MELSIKFMSSDKLNKSQERHAFHTRLRQLETTCEFSNSDREVKSHNILTIFMTTVKSTKRQQFDIERTLRSSQSI